MLTFIFISIIFFAAGLIQGLSGFGSALVAMPLLTLFIGVKTAVPLCSLNGLIITFYLSLNLRQHIDREKILPLIAGSLPGIYLGVNFLKHTDSFLIEVLLGILIVCYGGYFLLYNPMPRRIHRVWSYLAGFSTGFIGSAFSAGGPPTIIYTTLTGWSRDQIKATLSAFFFASGVITVGMHAVSGITDALVLRYFFISSVFVLFGVYAGNRLYSRLSREEYIRTILIALIILGAMMTVLAFRRDG
ncbi:MAG: sulfite exporter TauE/SafE family protein [Nitrospiraceae bacterium]|nr:MAG: sulfite exporter TauE/SafE family protein [Nitrospiraceae bacterium]